MNRIFTISILFLILFSVNVFSQTADTTGTSPGSVSTRDDFVDLSDQATVIKIEPEKPRVTLITDRIKPEFTDVNLNKSFKKELLSKSDRDLLQKKVTPNQNSMIDIEKIINKSR